MINGDETYSARIKGAKKVCNTFTTALATPDKYNVGAIAFYKKAGFQLVSAQVIPNEAWLLYDSSL